MNDDDKYDDEKYDYKLFLLLLVVFGYRNSIVFDCRWVVQIDRTPAKGRCER